VRLLTYGLYSVVFHGIATRFLRMGFLEGIDFNNKIETSLFFALAVIISKCKKNKEAADVSPHPIYESG
jgi:hypothetical protein